MRHFYNILLLLLFTTTALTIGYDDDEDARPKQETKCNKTACVIKNFDSAVKPYYFVSECKADSIRIINFVENKNCRDIPSQLFEVVRSLLVLTLNESAVEDIPKDTFKQASKLEELYLSNNLIKELELNVFDGAFSLNKIDLNHNQIHVIDPETFKKLYHLRYLNLAHNDLEQLDKNLFSENAKLHSVDLSENKLVELDMNMFYSCKDLTWVYLQQNQLKKLHLRNKYNSIYWLNADENQLNELRLDVDQVKNREAMIQITANKNRISKLKVSPMYNVRALYLENNKFIDIFEIMAMSSLSDLRLGNNNLSHVSSNTFKNLRHLEILYVHNTNLTAIHTKMFENQKKLTVLHIGYNQLGMIDLRFLKNLTSLERLHIDGNGLTELNVADINELLPNLKQIELRDNNWACDKLKVIVNYLKSYGIALVSTETDTESNVDGIACKDEQKEIDVLKKQIEVLEGQMKQLVEIYNENFCLMKDVQCCDLRELRIFSPEKGSFGNQTNNYTNGTKTCAL